MFGRERSQRFGDLTDGYDISAQLIDDAPKRKFVEIVPMWESSLAIARPVRLRSRALSGYPRNQSAMPECMQQHTPGS